MENPYKSQSKRLLQFKKGGYNNMNDMKIEFLAVDELKPYANNAKEHPAEQIEQIKKSIEEFGFRDPIAIWNNNEIIEGHGRLMAAIELGIDTVPVVRLDDMTDEQRRAYMLVHNKLTMNSGFNPDLLAMELDDITDINMDDFGFGDLDIPDDEPMPEKDINYNEKISVVIDCESETEAELIFNKLSEDGYTCRISTL